jgi:GNAT superfamily N-acetyltransferase
VQNVLFESTLSDGRRVVFRPIEAGDKKLLSDGFARLSPESRYRRFFRSMDHLSEAQLTYLTEVDQRDHVAWVALLPDAPEGERGAGVARWVRLRNEPDTAEGAVTVVDSLHGLGIGKTLLYLITREAIAKGIKRTKAWVLGDNHQVQAMLSHMGAHPGEWESGAVEMTIPLPSDPEELDATAVPLILKAVASGQLIGRATAAEGGGTELHLSPPSEDVQPIKP